LHGLGVGLMEKGKKLDKAPTCSGRRWRSRRAGQSWLMLTQSSARKERDAELAGMEHSMPRRRRQPGAHCSSPSASARP